MKKSLSCQAASSKWDTIHISSSHGQEAVFEYALSILLQA